jgi:hypothetical protein
MVWLSLPVIRFRYYRREKRPFLGITPDERRRDSKVSISYK